MITGIAGFIGSNVADRFLRKGKKVIGIDNLSRESTEKNLRWLGQNHKNWEFYFKDIRDRGAVEKIIAVEKPDAIIHLAGQVAVTTSVVNPQEDKEINVDGTLNVLDAARRVSKKIAVVYSSTNKVYGELKNLKIIKSGRRYEFADKKIKRDGILENQILDFYSPYGCSKGAADQYVHDYARIYGMPAVVFRQSCIYGRRQFGNEDQGWVMHFVRNAVAKKSINIYGDGRQVRDVLNIEDLVDVYEVALDNLRVVSGKIYNIGGGSQNTISLLELVRMLEKKTGRKIELKFGDWRLGDQKVYVSGIAKTKKELGWNPKVGVSEGIDDLILWAKEILFD